MKLFLFFKISVVLSETFQSKLIRRFNVLRFTYVLFLETFDLLGIGSTKKGDLRTGHNLDDFLNNF